MVRKKEKKKKKKKKKKEEEKSQEKHFGMSRDLNRWILSQEPSALSIRPRHLAIFSQLDEDSAIF